METKNLRRLLNYDRSTGKFTRQIDSGRVKAGDAAERLQSNGYLYVSADKQNLLAHRLAWFFVYNIFPDGDIDHKNGDRTDNRLQNLRVVTRGQNLQNRRGARKGSASGLLGVQKNANSWMARITTEKVVKYLGTFQTKEAAYEAYLQAKRVLHPFGSL